MALMADFDRTALDRALDGFRFDEAEALVEEVDGDLGESLRNEIAERRATGEAWAQERYQRIIELGGESRYAELAELQRDPLTKQLLDLLPGPARKRAELHLKEARRWEDSRREVAARRLREARKALRGLDLELASGLLARLEDRFLDDEQRQQRDQLREEVSARRKELATLERVGRQLLTETDRKQQRPPWWKRWLR